MRTHLRKFAALPAAVALAFGVAACEDEGDTAIVEDEPDTVIEGDDGGAEEGGDVDVEADVEAGDGEADADAEADAETEEDDS